MRSLQETKTTNQQQEETEMKKIVKLKIQAAKIHERVCDIHFDSSMMNDDMTCRECQDDLHEAEILAR